MCTRATYLGLDDIVITTRTLDWFAPLGTNLWAYPRGVARDGAAGPDSLRWVSRYGSVTASGFEACTIDGINEPGLVANMLYLAEADYGSPPPGDQRKPISVAAWAQYALDHFATVAEAVAALRQEPFYVKTVETPDGHAGTVHLSLSDPSGDSAIFEYVGGNLVIHHGHEYQVMTNSPIYDEQLALNAYWEQIGGTVMLPGTSRAADRFVRASFYIKAVPQTAELVPALASAFGVIRNASVPLGITTPGQPNISSTLWRTVADQKNRVYYFESAQSPFLIWIDLDAIDFSEGAPSRKITLTHESALLRDDAFVSGDVTALFAPAEPFAFLPA
ncbi:MAG: linear amide C-N hydrolase [Thermomicrobiales bacterium]